MCIVFTCGEHTFRKEVEGYEGVVCRCYNCGNYSGHVIKTHPWFTFCFIPVIPLSIHGYEDVTCHICNFAQPLEHRPDVQAMRHGGGGGGGGGPPPIGGGGNVPMHPQGQPPGPARYG
ncbi:ribonuclease p complex subunit [Niveomyces insectorum RCEF 264]|uniref:Ribonuclease p complex subunit n=1 Tax=Niveomyces insectorum RCEF 264 TaxID=1081102 RepID=A0A168A455_9HYPO|nr:ribonuclease p complex subunit [Niveomyces insectorum RCEF 264]